MSEVSGMIAIPASLRSDFIHIPGTLIHIALESTIHITGIASEHHAPPSPGTLSPQGSSVFHSPSNRWFCGKSTTQNLLAGLTIREGFCAALILQVVGISLRKITRIFGRSKVQNGSRSGSR